MRLLQQLLRQWFGLSLILRSWLHKLISFDMIWWLLLSQFRWCCPDFYIAYFRIWCSFDFHVFFCLKCAINWREWLRQPTNSVRQSCCKKQMNWYELWDASINECEMRTACWCSSRLLYCFRSIQDLKPEVFLWHCVGHTYEHKNIYWTIVPLFFYTHAVPKPEHWVVHYYYISHR